jgi:hypothetical protein
MVEKRQPDRCGTAQLHMRKEQLKGLSPPNSQLLNPHAPQGNHEQHEKQRKPLRLEGCRAAQQQQPGTTRE